MLVQAILDSDLLGNLCIADDEGGWCQGIDVEIKEVSEIVLFSEPVPVVVGKDVRWKSSGHPCGD